MKKQAEPSDPLDSLIKRVKAAQQIYKNFSQSQVDAIFKAAAAAAAAQRIPLETKLSKIILPRNTFITNIKMPKLAALSKLIKPTVSKFWPSRWVLLPVLFQPPIRPQPPYLSLCFA